MRLRYLAHRSFTDHSISYRDIHLGNVLYDKTFTKAMAIDWGPATEKIRGVEEVNLNSAEGKAAADKYLKFLKTELVADISVVGLKAYLKDYGQQLRP